MKEVIRRARLRIRSVSAIVIFLVVAILVPAKLGIANRLIIAWDSSAVIFLSLAWPMMARSTPERMRRRARLQDEDRWVFLALTVGAATVSLFATAASLHSARNYSGLATALHLALAAVTIILAWGVMHTSFALHYAHMYYGDTPGGQDQGGFDFPEDTQPDYWDFMYASLVIGMTNQVSDVPVNSRPMRRLVMGHSVLSFFFNAVVLALTINMIAGAI